MTPVKIDDDAVLVVGTGYVGRRFIAQLPSAVGLSRSPISPLQQTAVFDLDDDVPLPLSLPDHYSVLYTVPPSSDFETDVRLERLLERLMPVPQRFVYISTTGVYGNHDGESVNEETPVNPENDRARRRVAAEELLRAWCTRHDSEFVVLRVPGIYGPERLGIRRIREAAAVIAEQDVGPGNRIHVDDLVRCCEAAISNDAPAGIVNVGDGDHRSSTWFTNEVARQSNLAPPPTISMAAAEREFSPMRLSFLKESRRVSTAKMRDVLGVNLRYANAEDGIRASIAEERS
ncbi:MAG: NAD-dependent epimerase/dehydratase family protein [Gammaproteobacteria bacterium]|nr:NAD-dependent epimerase/dehydratase family protein [Gammaproteobacteria bacterium]